MYVNCKTTWTNFSHCLIAVLSSGLGLEIHGLGLRAPRLGLDTCGLGLG